MAEFINMGQLYKRRNGKRRTRLYRFENEGPHKDDVVTYKVFFVICYDDDKERAIRN